MKNLTTLKKKIISDKKLSFLFLINKIKYKKLKSISKRPLLPHYVIYRFLLKSLHITYNSAWYRNFVQSNLYLNLVLPGSFLEKRMFYKNTKLLSTYTHNVSNSYIWYNSKTNSFFKKSVHFNKFNSYPTLGGQNMLTTPLKEEMVNILNKNVFSKKTPNINLFIFFNTALINILELYKINTLLWVFDSYKNN